LIAHMLPIRRCARDLFRSSLAVLVLTPLDKSGLPPLELLHGLFDLTPAEATLARALCEGVQIGAFAKSMGVKRDTIKKRLDAIFQKTGVRRQSDLVRLLLGLSPIGDDEPNED